MFGRPSALEQSCQGRQGHLYQFVVRAVHLRGDVMFEMGAKSAASLA